jgi:type II secretory pathway pseudopilin PulG
MILLIRRNRGRQKVANLPEGRERPGLSRASSEVPTHTSRAPGVRARMRECRVRLRGARHALRNSPGFTYIGLLLILVIIGISLGAAGKYWQNVMLREKEEELLFRGDQYRQAIERYYYAIPGRPQYPRSIDDLLQDSRTPAGKRHLRRRYKDPMTSKDFVVIESTDASGKHIIGVRSSSDKTPLKQSNFPDAYQDFAGKDKYSDWQFVAVIQPPPQASPAPPGRRPPLPVQPPHP